MPDVLAFENDLSRFVQGMTFWFCKSFQHAK
jgi:hypothetical protein